MPVTDRRYRRAARGVVQQEEIRGPRLNLLVLVTTAAGLYRFNIGDVVRCRSFMGQAPVLEFFVRERVRQGDPIPAGAQVVDGDGKYILPGLWDALVNYLADPNASAQEALSTVETSWVEYEANSTGG